MRVALLGNMNNNHFSLMRYMRDLGVDCYLLLYKEDGKGVNSHFIPENDTWNIKKWDKYIISTRINNGGIKGIINLFLNYSQNKRLLNDFDLIIGNGFAPAISYVYNLKLELFLPYSYGIEFTKERISYRNQLSRISRYFQYTLQNLGLSRNTKFIGTIDFTKDNIKPIVDLGLEEKLIELSIPMLYIEERHSDLSNYSKELALFNKNSKNRFPIIFCHVSHLKSELGRKIKRLDKLIDGLKLFLEKSPTSKPIIFFLEYGDDIQNVKSRIRKLELEDYIYWLPKTSRKVLLEIIKNCDIGASEFGGAFWGGTGWEFLSCNKPFFHNIGMSVNEFERTTGYDMPDIFNVESASDICDILFSLDQVEFINQDRQDLAKWFNRYNGKSSALKIFNLISK